MIGPASPALEGACVIVRTVGNKPDTIGLERERNDEWTSMCGGEVLNSSWHCNVLDRSIPDCVREVPEETPSGQRGDLMIHAM